MNLTTCILILTFAHVASSKTCVIGNRAEKDTLELKLQKDLMKDYDTYTAPCSTVTVAVRFTVNRFNFDSKLGIFSTYSTVTTIWNDDRLKWDPNKYNGLNDTTLLSIDLWRPHLKLYNNIDADDQSYFFFAYCKIKSDGRVLCITRVNYEVHCDTKLTYWPFDVQNCSLQFGTTKSINYKVKLKFSSRISWLVFQNGAEWDVVDYNGMEDWNSDVQLHMSFILERQALGLAAMIIYPSIILSLLTAICLTLDVRKDIRLYLVCFSLLCHFYFLDEVGQVMPDHSSDTPIVLLYFRGSILVTLFVIIMTSLLNVLCKKETPIWPRINSVNNILLESRWKVMIWPRWDNFNTIIEVNESIGDWTNFANIVNSFCLFLVIVVYLSLYVAFIPSAKYAGNFTLHSL